MAQYQLLRITDGIDSINLTSRVGPFRVTSWFPSTQELKDGGVWQSGSFTDGAKLVAFNYSYGQESIDVAIHSQDINEIFESKQLLNRLLIKAMQYWTTSWQTQPVWIEARASLETNTRYAVIKAGRVSSGSDQINPPLISKRVARRADIFQIGLVRGFWQDVIPGTATDLAISTNATFHANQMGRSTTILDEVFFGNHNVLDNIPYVYYQVHGGGAWSANLQSTADRDLLPNPIVAADCTYFGSYWVGAELMTFSSLIFDIKTVVGGGTGVWEYWTGAAWAAIATIFDGTVGFTLTGVHHITFTPPINWASTDVHGITTLWVRWRVTVGGAFVPPTQQFRWIYTINNGNTNFLGADIKGSIPSLLHLKVHQRGCGELGVGPLIAPDRLILGTRSINRGVNFSAFINLARYQSLYTGWSTTLTGGAWSTNLNSPCGTVLRWAPGAATGSTSLAFAQIGPANTANYYGTYHAYVRGNLYAGLTGSGSVKISINGTSSAWASFNAAVDYQLLDLGMITVSSRDVRPGITPGLTVMFVFGITTSAAAAMDLYDIILIPVDEWSGDMTYPYMIVDGDSYLDIDSALNPKVLISCLHMDNVWPAFYNYIYQAHASNPICLQPNTSQSLWGLAVLDNTGVPTANPWIFWSLEVENIARYLTNRGSE